MFWINYWSVSFIREQILGGASLAESFDLQESVDVTEAFFRGIYFVELYTFCATVGDPVAIKHVIESGSVVGVIGQHHFGYVSSVLILY